MTKRQSPGHVVLSEFLRELRLNRNLSLAKFCNQYNICKAVCLKVRYMTYTPSIEFIESIVRNLPTTLEESYKLYYLSDSIRKSLTIDLKGLPLEERLLFSTLARDMRYLPGDFINSLLEQIQTLASSEKAIRSKQLQKEVKEQTKRDNAINELNEQLKTIPNEDLSSTLVADLLKTTIESKRKD